MILRQLIHQTSPISTQYAREACAMRLICRCARWYDQIKCLTCHNGRSPSLSLLSSPGIPRNNRAAAALSGSRCGGSRALPPWLEQLSPVLTDIHTHTHTTHSSGTKSRWMMLLPGKRHAFFGWEMDGTWYAWLISSLTRIQGHNTRHSPETLNMASVITYDPQALVRRKILFCGKNVRL